MLKNTEKEEEPETIIEKQDSEISQVSIESFNINCNEPEKVSD